MKKSLLILFLLVFVGVFLVGGVGAVTEISNCQDLQGISRTTFGQYEEYKLVNNIDCSEMENFNPIQRFNGSFDGQGYNITNLEIGAKSYGNKALFLMISYNSDSEVKNLNLINVSVETESGYDGAALAILVQVGEENRGIIQNCHVTGDIICGSNARCGGIASTIGRGGLIKNSSFIGTVNGFDDAGGLAGVNLGTIENSYFKGIVNASDAGGLVYQNSGTIKNSYSEGEVMLRDITEDSTKIGGGLVGYNSRTIEKSYSTGEVSGDDNYVGGLVGWNSGGTIENSYWDKDTSGQDDSDGGEGKSTNQMRDVDTFGSWSIGEVDEDSVDENYIWNIVNEDDKVSYPFLSWEGGRGVVVDSHIELEPPTSGIGVGEIQRYTAKLIDSNGEKEDVTDDASFSSSKPNVANNSAGDNVFKGLDEGETTVLVSYEGLSSSVTLNVVDSGPDPPGPRQKIACSEFDERSVCKDNAHPNSSDLDGEELLQAIREYGSSSGGNPPSCYDFEEESNPVGDEWKANSSYDSDEEWIVREVPDGGKNGTHIKCGLIYSCGCGWGSGSCNSITGWVETIDNCIPASSDLYNRFGSCETEVGDLIGECVEPGDEYTVSWTAEWYDENGNSDGESSENNCESGDVKFPCPPMTVEPFFSLVNFVIAGFLTLIFYFFFVKTFRKNEQF